MHVGHRSRLKAKFSRVGLDGFEDHEVLEYLLTFAIPQKDVNPLAHQLIRHFGSLNAVFNARREQLTEISGIGEHAASLITLIPQISKRYLDEPSAFARYSMARIDDRISYFIPKFVGEREECMYAAFLNNAMEVLACERIFDGALDAVHVEGRKLIDFAVRYKANSIIVAHNHFGHVDPSMDDIIATQNLGAKLDACGIVLLDHIIVCRGNGLSLLREGKMNRAV